MRNNLGKEKARQAFAGGLSGWMIYDVGACAVSVGSGFAPLPLLALAGFSALAVIAAIAKSRSLESIVGVVEICLISSAFKAFKSLARIKSAKALMRLSKGRWVSAQKMEALASLSFGAA